MDGPYIAEIGSLVGDPARANMLMSLMGGQALTATELALNAGVTAQTASGHLSRLVAGGMLLATSQGRHRYFRLASPRIAEMLEVLMETAVDGPPRHRPRSMRDPALAEARTCYNHLAGRVAVAIADGLRSRGVIELDDEAGLVTQYGEAFFAEFGIVAARKRDGPAFCRPCLDWSERRLHIGGALGTSIFGRLEELCWVRRERHSRVVMIMPSGIEGLRRAFGVEVTA